MYSLAYSDFVMPMVNAIKEQQIQIAELRVSLHISGNCTHTTGQEVGLVDTWN
jgi:hypothetical protein